MNRYRLMNEDQLSSEQYTQLLEESVFELQKREGDSSKWEERRSAFLRAHFPSNYSEDCCVEEIKDILTEDFDSLITKVSVGYASGEAEQVYSLYDDFNTAFRKSLSEIRFLHSPSFLLLNFFSSFSAHSLPTHERKSALTRMTHYYN